MLIHTKTKQEFKNRLEAKLVMGSAKFNKALKNNEFIFITTYDKDDIIL